MVVGEPLRINERNSTLSGVLADGSPFSFDLNNILVDGEDFFGGRAVLTVTLFQGLPGDYNGDGIVNAADFVVWKNHEGQTFQLPNEDPITTPGEVTEGDYYVWRHNFGRERAGGGI